MTDMWNKEMIQYVTLGISKEMKKNAVFISIAQCLLFFIRNELKYNFWRMQNKKEKR